MILAERIDKHDSKFSTFKTKAENEFNSLSQKINNKENTGKDPDHLVKTQFNIIEQKLADILHNQVKMSAGSASAPSPPSLGPNQMILPTCKYSQHTRTFISSS